jgi:hypothetical protein
MDHIVFCNFSIGFYSLFDFNIGRKGVLKGLSWELYCKCHKYTNKVLVSEWDLDLTFFSGGKLEDH